MKVRLNANKFYIPLLSQIGIGFILGIIMGFYIKISFLILYCLSLCCLVFLFYLHKKSKRANRLIVLIFFLIGMLHQINSITLYVNDIYSLSKQNIGDVSVEGIVASHIEQGPYDKSFVFYPIRVWFDDYQLDVRGKLYVRFNKRLKLEYGDHLDIEGRLKPLNDKGYFNQRLIRQGIRSALVVGPKDWITLKQTKNFSIMRLAFITKEKLKERFRGISSPARDFLVAFILGDRVGLSKEMYSVFRYTGTVHILAISGLHVGIFIFIFLVFLKILRIKRKPRFVITILFLLFYCFLTGLRPSVVRAVIMATILLVSYIVEREYHIYNSLVLAAMIILGIWPWQIFDIGFQLSFVSVISIVFIYPKIMILLPKIKNRFFAFIQASFVVSLSATLGATPLVAYYFGIISFISIVANVILVMFMPLIIASGFIYLMFSFIAPFLNKWIAISLEFMIYCILLFAATLKNIPFSYVYVDRFPIYVLFLYYGLILSIFNIHLLNKKARIPSD